MNTRNLRFRSNRVRDVISLFHAELDALYGDGEVRTMLEMLFEEYLEWGRTAQLLHRDDTINQSDLLRFHWALEGLLRWQPIQHIIGHVDFCGCRITTTPDALIPRPETEEMVLAIIEAISAKKIGGKNGAGLRIIDLCTGSGCIAIALAKAFPLAEVVAQDISEQALTLAQQNAHQNGVQVCFQQVDLLSAEEVAMRGQYALIISNPPYILPSERNLMQANVLDYEPHEALFVSEKNPLCFHRAIAHLAQQHLAEGGLLAMEINEALGGEVLSLLKAEGFSPALHHDFRLRPRWVEATRI